MHRSGSGAPEHAELLKIIGQVRRRWRLKLALRGLALISACALAVLLVALFVLDKAAFSPELVIGARAAVAVLFLGLIGWFLVRPLARPISDERAALYLEEHEPSLHTSVLSALAAGTAGEPGSSVSPGLARRTIETALVRAREVEHGRRIEKRSLQKSSGALAAVAIAALLIFWGGPGFVRNGAQTMLLPLGAA